MQKRKAAVGDNEDHGATASVQLKIADDAHLERGRATP
jgi:hypothetical protein